MSPLSRLRRRSSAASPRPPATTGEGHELPGMMPLVDERLILHRHLAAAGLAVPRLLGAIGRVGGFSALSGRPLPDIDAVIAFLRDEVPGDLMVRPSAVAAPEATRHLRRHGDVLIEPGDRRTGIARYAAELLGAHTELFIVQEGLRDGGDGGEPGGPTPLVLGTVVAPDGEIEVLPAVPPAGAPLPGWDEAHALVRAAAPRLLPLRAVRWSVALTADGPLLLDARPGRIPVAAHGADGRPVAAAAGDVRGRPR